MEGDGGVGFQLGEVSYPVCIYQEKSKDSVYHQECYPKSIIAGLSAGDVDPEHDDRVIVNCGCCPSNDMFAGRHFGSQRQHRCLRWRS